MHVVPLTALVVLFHRETKEECGLDVTNLDKVGVLKFEFVNEPQILEVHVFRTTQFSGVVSESEGIVTDQRNSKDNFLNLQRCVHNGLTLLTFLTMKCGQTINCGTPKCLTTNILMDTSNLKA